MFDSDGTFHFVPELLQAVDAFVEGCEAAKGSPQNDLERGLIISYALGTIRCDLEMIWESLGSAPAFGTLHPRAVFENCTDRDDPRATTRRAMIEEELQKRGWLPGAEEGPSEASFG